MLRVLLLLGNNYNGKNSVSVEYICGYLVKD